MSEIILEIQNKINRHKKSMTLLINEFKKLRYLYLDVLISLHQDIIILV